MNNIEIKDNDWKMRILEAKLNNLRVEFNALLYFIKEYIVADNEETENINCKYN